MIELENTSARLFAVGSVRATVREELAHINGTNVPATRDAQKIPNLHFRLAQRLTAEIRNLLRNMGVAGVLVRGTRIPTFGISLVGMSLIGLDRISDLTGLLAPGRYVRCSFPRG